VVLRAVHVGPGGAIDHRVRVLRDHYAVNGVRVPDVELVARKRSNLVPGVLSCGDEVAAEHPGGPRDQHPQRISTSELSPIMNR
jgi:hypothetical protein